MKIGASNVARFVAKLQVHVSGYAVDDKYILCEQKFGQFSEISGRQLNT